MKINSKYINTKVLYVFFPLLISLLSCKKENQEVVLFTGDQYENLMQYIEKEPDYSSFRDIVYAGRMTDVLSSYNSNGGVGYTLFLPTNEGVDKFINESERYETLPELLQDTAYSAEILRYHLVNGAIPGKDFPNGALPNKTISNYFLTILFREEGEDSVSFSVNDEAGVITTDINKDNGIIHTVDQMLTPVVFTSYEWVEESLAFTIFYELLSKCGLADTLNAFELDELGREVYSEYTLFAESDLLYLNNGIRSFEDLVKVIDPEGSQDQDFTSFDNLVNKYARYHILERSVFLDEFVSAVYNTYGDMPVSVDLDDILKVNTGTMVFDTIINGGDTIIVDYLQVNEERSNNVTRNGPIHQLNHLLFPFLPGLKTVTYQFYEEPVINALRDIEGNHSIGIEELEYISLIGTNGLTYVKSPTAVSGASNRDYIEFSGDVDFRFVTPKILAGRYSLRLVLQRGYSYLASIQAAVDDKKVGVVLDLKPESQTFRTFTLGTVEFSDFSSHTVKLRTVLPGRVLIDRIIFVPIN